LRSRRLLPTLRGIGGARGVKRSRKHAKRGSTGVVLGVNSVANWISNWCLFPLQMLHNPLIALINFDARKLRHFVALDIGMTIDLRFALRFRKSLRNRFRWQPFAHFSLICFEIQAI